MQSRVDPLHDSRGLSITIHADILPASRHTGLSGPTAQGGPAQHGLSRAVKIDVLLNQVPWPILYTGCKHIIQGIRMRDNCKVL